MFDELANAGDKVVGVKQVERALFEGTIRRVYIASDADEPLRRRIVELASEKGIDHVMVAKKKQLGELCGIDVGASCAALKK